MNPDGAGMDAEGSGETCSAVAAAGSAAFKSTK